MAEEVHKKPLYRQMYIIDPVSELPLVQQHDEQQITIYIQIKTEENERGGSKGKRRKRECCGGSFDMQIRGWLAETSSVYGHQMAAVNYGPVVTLIRDWGRHSWKHTHMHTLPAGQR